jgi:hypothetical protein
MRIAEIPAEDQVTSVSRVINEYQIALNVHSLQRYEMKIILVCLVTDTVIALAEMPFCLF